MRTRRITGVAVATAVAVFAIAAGRVLWRETAAVASDTRIIRFAHPYLEPGLREAYDASAREYMDRNPGVRLEQIAVPQRIYAAWSKTQLLGGTAPDLLVVDGGVFTLEDLARHFAPLHPWMERPNPHNLGSHAGLPWRETFIDGMTGSYDSRLLSYYSVPTSLFTHRIFYNRTLWREIFGTEEPPADFDGFLAACAAIGRWGEGRNRPIVPLAGSVYHAPFLTDFLFGTQTQRLQFEVAWSSHLRADLSPALALLQDRWRVDQPELTRAFSIVREVGRQLQRGFLQLQRDDANFAFLQGRAAMLASGAHEAESLRVQAGFDLGVFRLPVPGPSHPRYGAGMLGPVTEANLRPAGAFALTLRSRHPEVAMDFLRFLTSEEGAAAFTARSGWLTAVAEVPIPEKLRPFQPTTDGFANGFDLSIRRRHPEAKRIADVHQHLLLQEGDDDVAIAAYTAALVRDYPGALRRDLRSRTSNTLRNVMRQDSNLAAWRWLALDSPSDPLAQRRLNEVAEQIDGNEAENSYILHELARTDAKRDTR